MPLLFVLPYDKIAAITKYKAIISLYDLSDREWRFIWYADDIYYFYLVDNHDTPAIFRITTDKNSFTIKNSSAYQFTLPKPLDWLYIREIIAYLFENNTLENNLDFIKIQLTKRLQCNEDLQAPFFLLASEIPDIFPPLNFN